MDRPIFRVITPVVLALVLCALFMLPVSAADPAPMAPSSVSIETEIESAAAQALGEEPPITATHYAVTHYSNPSTDYYLLSVTGLSTTTPTDWNLLDDSIWWGNVIVYSDSLTTAAAVEGTITYTNMISDVYGSGTFEAMQMDPAFLSSTSEAVYFPWQPGTRAYYGYTGVHAGVYGLTGDYAVDWFGGGSYADMPNMVYASQSGTITRVCEDGVSIGLVIGNFGYLHLQPYLSFTEGQYIAQGTALGPMVLGSFSDSCGYADQQPANYHVHWAFVPSGNYFQAENWTLNIVDETWRYGGDTVDPQEYMTSLWNGSAPPSTPMPTVTPGGPTLTPSPTAMYAPPPEVGGASFWDPIVYGIWDLVGSILQSTPDHNEIGLATTYVSAAAVVFRVSFVLLASNFNLTVLFFVLGVMLIMEGWRIVTAVFRKIFEFIGYILKFIPFLG